LKTGGGTLTGAAATACTEAGFTCKDAEFDLDERNYAFGYKG